MSKRRTKATDIRNPENYFNRFIALEVKRDKEQQKAYYNAFDSLDEVLDGGSKGVSSETLMHFATNRGGEDFDRYMSDTYPLAWLDVIENPTLAEAVKALSREDKWLLTLRFKYDLSQAETAEILQVVQSSVSRQENRLKKYFEEFFAKAHRNP